MIQESERTLQTTKSTEKRESSTPKQKEKRFPFFRKGISNGLFAGAGMGLYLIILEAFIDDPSVALKFLKYIILAVVLGMAIVSTRKVTRDRLFFKRGALLGLFISFVSAITLIAINSFAYIVGAEVAFDKFNMNSSTFSGSLLVDGVLLFEVVVYGMILTFIWLQYLKGYTEKKA